MTTSREAFLKRIRSAVEEGNRAGHTTRLESRGATGYQGAGPDLASHFCEALAVVGGQAHRVPTGEAAVAQVLELAQGRSIRRAVLGHHPLLCRLGLAERLRAAGVETVAVETLSRESCRDPLFASDLGISVPDFLIAETGTIALRARPDEPRSVSLLPPVHVVVAERAHLVPDLFDLFDKQHPNGIPSLPSCLTLITGPSKTGDIELRLVTGVHGPGEVHVILIDG